MRVVTLNFSHQFKCFLVVPIKKPFSRKHQNALIQAVTGLGYFVTGFTATSSFVEIGVVYDPFLRLSDLVNDLGLTDWDVTHTHGTQTLDPTVFVQLSW